MSQNPYDYSADYLSNVFAEKWVGAILPLLEGEEAWELESIIFDARHGDGASYMFALRGLLLLETVRSLPLYNDILIDIQTLIGHPDFQSLNGAKMLHLTYQSTVG